MFWDFDDDGISFHAVQQYTSGRRGVVYILVWRKRAR